jgi:2-alkenal reductase
MLTDVVMVGWSTRLLWVVVLAQVAFDVTQRQVTSPLLATSKDQANEPADIIKEIERSLSTLFERVSPSVVRISTIRGGDPDEAGVRIGSGFVWDSAGHVVTNEHVVRDATIIWVFLASGKDIEAEGGWRRTKL